MINKTRKLLVLALLATYIFNIATIGYSSSQNNQLNLKIQNEKLAMTSNLNDKKLIFEFYEKPYQSTFKKNWNQLTPEQKKLFFYIGTQIEISSEIKKLNLKKIQYLADLVEKYGHEKNFKYGFWDLVHILGTTKNNDIGLAFLDGAEKFLLKTKMIQPSQIQKKKKKKKEKRINQTLKQNENVLNITLSIFTNLLITEAKILQEKNFYENIKNKLAVSQQKEKNSMLLKACSLGYAKIAELMLDNGAEIEAKNQYGQTGLMLASQNGHLEIVKLFIKKNAYITTVDSTELKSNAFILASDFAQYETLEYLISVNKGQVNSVDAEGNTPLMLAAKNGDDKSVQLFLENGANINQADKHGWTALMYACQAGHTSTVKLFLKNKAEVNVLNENNENALIISCEKMHSKVVKILLKANANIAQQSKNNTNAFIVALSKTDIPTIKLLLKYNVSLNEIRNILNYARQLKQQNPDNKKIDQIIELLKISFENKKSLPITFLESALDGDNKKLSACLQQGVDIETKNSELETALIFAIKKNHYSTVKLLLKKGANLNFQNKQGSTPLAIACEFGDIKIVKLLLKKAPQLVNEKNNFGQTPLMVACRNGSEQTAKLLLTNGAQITDVDNEGYNALGYASLDGQDEMIKFLLAEYQKLNHKLNDADSLALLNASRGLHPSTIQLLLDAGISIGTKDLQGHTALIMACLEKSSNKNDAKKSIELLLARGSKIDETNTNATTSLMVASLNGNEEQVKILLSHNANIHLQDKNKMNALIYAINTDQVKILEIFLDKKYSLKFNEIIEALMYAENFFNHKQQNHADTKELKKIITLLKLAIKEKQNQFFKAVEDGNEQELEKLLEEINIDPINKNDETALMIAIKNKRYSMVEFLIAHGFDVNTENKHGETPLMTACKYKDLKMAQLLQSKGVDILKKNKIGETPLMIASLFGADEIVEWLIGIDKNLIDEVDNYGSNAVAFAGAGGNNSTLKILLQNRRLKPADFTAIFLAIQQGHLETVRFLVKIGVPIDCRDNNGTTPLMFASQTGTVQIAECLLMNKADARLTNNYGFTSLIFASTFGNDDVLKLLLSRINYQQNDLNLALIFACNHKIKKDGKAVPVEHASTVRLLLEYGADPSYRFERHEMIDANDTTVEYSNALLYATENNFFETIKILLDSKTDVNVQDINLETPLIIATRKRNFKLVKLILQYKPDLEMKNFEEDENDQFGEEDTGTALALAIHREDIPIGETSITELLLQHGANIEATDSTQETPLTIAVREKEIELTKLLLKYGAKIIPAQVRENTNTPLTEATSRNKIEIIKLFLRLLTDIKGSEAELQKALEFAQNDEITTLFENEQNYRSVLLAHWDNFETIPPAILTNIYAINYQDADGNTALHKAVMLGDLKLIEAILRNPNVDLNIRNNETETGGKDTALHLAIIVGNQDVIKALLKHSQINLNLENAGGETALHLTLMAGPEYFEIATLLLENGALIKKENLRKFSKLKHAILYPQDLFNQGDFAQVENWIESAEKEKLLKLLKSKFILQLLKERNFKEYFKEITDEILDEISKILIFLNEHNVMNDLTENLLKKLNSFMTLDKKMYSDFDVKKLAQIRTMGI